MTVNEIYDKFGKMIDEGYGDLDVDCSIDMSVDGNEKTYGNRVFGYEPFLIRYNILTDIDGSELIRTAQILFEKGQLNYE